MSLIRPLSFFEQNLKKPTPLIYVIVDLKKNTPHVYPHVIRGIPGDSSMSSPLKLLFVFRQLPITKSSSFERNLLQVSTSATGLHPHYWQRGWRNETWGLLVPSPWVMLCLLLTLQHLKTHYIESLKNVYTAHYLILRPSTNIVSFQQSWPTRMVHTCWWPKSRFPS